MPSKSRSGNSANSKVTISYDSIEVSPDGSQARITNAKLTFSSSSGWSDSTNRGRVRGGAVTDATLFTNKTLNGGTDSWNASETWVDLLFSGTTTRQFIGEVAGVSFYENDDNNDWFGPSMTVTYPRRVYSTPAVPSLIELRRMSDTSMMAMWGGNDLDAESPTYWEFVDLELQIDSETSAWITLGSLPGVMTAEVFSSGSAANHRYRFRIRSRNADNVSDWGVSGWLSTTPAAPVGPTATRSGVGIVLVNDGLAAPFRDGWQAQVLQDETGSWTDLDSGAVVEDPSLLDAVRATTSAWRYRVRNVVLAVPTNTGPVDLVSAWVETGLVLGVPEPPTLVTAARKAAGDGTSVVGWTRAASYNGALRPYTTQEVQYQLNDPAGAPVNLSTTLTPAQTSIEQTTLPNSRYRYRARAVNSSGPSPWSAWSDWLATVPSAPTVQTPGKIGSTVVVANWLNTAPYLTGSVFGWSEDGGAEFDPGLAAGPSATSQNRTVDPGKTHRYRVYHVVEAVPLAAGGTMTLVSAGSAWSATVQLQAPPDAPSVAVSAQVLDAAVTALTVNATHRPVDASSVTDGEVRYRIGSGSWTTLTTASSPAVTFPTSMLARMVLPAGTLTNDRTYEVQARTKGADASFGPWSAGVFVVTSGTPTATVSQPADGSEVDVATLTIALDWSDPELAAPAAWDVVVRDASLNELWAVRGAAGTLSAAPFVVPGLTILDDTTYVVDARGRDQAGLWSAWNRSTFTVDYALPPAAVVSSKEWRPDDGVVVLEITIPEPAVDETDAVLMDVEWFLDGHWLTIEEDLPTPTGGASTFVTHWTPPTTGGEVEYRVITKSAIPSARVADPVAVRVWSDGWIYLNGGPGFRTVAKVRGRKQETSSHGISKVFLTPVGRKKPIVLWDESESNAWHIGGSVAKHVWQRDALGTIEEWETISKVPGTMVLRDYRGERRFVEIDGDVSIDRLTGVIGCTVQEVDYVER